MLSHVLEWAAFLGSLGSVWAYGKSRSIGPVVGLGVSVLFMVYGLTSGVYAAAVSNVVFFYLHYKNWKDNNMMDWKKIKPSIAKGFRQVQDRAYASSKEAGWWDDVTTKEELWKSVPTKLCLIHSEISEVMEAHRRGKGADEKLPQHSSISTELADAVIRIADLAGALGIDLGPVIADKMEFNSIRPDHKKENRASANGKKY